MTSFAFTTEQIRTAPPEVRRWVENQIIAALAQTRPEHDPSQAHQHTAALAACSDEEAVRVLDLIKGNFLLTQVFFELGREMAGGAAAPLHGLDIGDLLRHTRVPDGDRLADCLSAINRAFQQVRGDPEASLFGFDQRGHVFVHETTSAAVRRLWQQLVAAPGPAAEAVETMAPAPFSLPQLGPSEAVAGHAPSPGHFGF